MRWWKSASLACMFIWIWNDMPTKSVYRSYIFGLKWARFLICRLAASCIYMHGIIQEMAIHIVKVFFSFSTKKHMRYKPCIETESFLTSFLFPMILWCTCSSRLYSLWIRLTFFYILQSKSLSKSVGTNRQEKWGKKKDSF